METIGQFLCVFKPHESRYWQSRVQGEYVDVTTPTKEIDKTLSPLEKCFDDLEQGKHERFLQWILQHPRPETALVISKLMPELAFVYAPIYALHFENNATNKFYHEELEKRIQANNIAMRVLRKEDKKLRAEFDALVAFQERINQIDMQQISSQAFFEKNQTKSNQMRLHYNSRMKAYDRKERCVLEERECIQRDVHKFKLRIAGELQGLIVLQSRFEQCQKALPSMKNGLGEIVKYLEIKAYPKPAAAAGS